MKNEQKMREEKVPFFKTEKELMKYIHSLAERKHDYGTCVYAMSMAATAAFNYIANKLGVSGFQASCADLDILRRTRLMEGPFIISKAEDMIYPQYDLQDKLREAMDECKPWCAEQAKKKLEECDITQVHPEVLAHWKKLAGVTK